MSMLQLLVTLLQFQCGSQQFGDVGLSYGSLVYVEDRSRVPQVIFFKEYSGYKVHPFCLTMQDSMKGNSRLKLSIDPQSNELLEVRDIPDVPHSENSRTRFMGPSS